MTETGWWGTVGVTSNNSTSSEILKGRELIPNYFPRESKLLVPVCSAPSSRARLVRREGAGERVWGAMADYHTRTAPTVPCASPPMAKSPTGITFLTYPALCPCPVTGLAVSQPIRSLCWFWKLLGDLTEAGGKGGIHSGPFFLYVGGIFVLKSMQGPLLVGHYEWHLDKRVWHIKFKKILIGLQFLLLCEIKKMLGK